MWKLIGSILSTLFTFGVNEVAIVVKGDLIRLSTGGTRLGAAVSSIQLSSQKLQPPRPFLFNPMLQISVDLGLGGARADWLCTASSLQGGGGVGCCVRSVQQLTETGRERQL